MPTYEKLKGVVSIASNSPHAPTGYGVQVKQLVERMVRHGLTTGILSNYGQEAQISDYKTPHGKATHFPHGYSSATHGVEMISVYHKANRAGKEQLPHALMTLYDVWVYNQLKFDDPIMSWVPIDHITLPPQVHRFLERENVHPITMSPHGQEVLSARGIENTYIPHALDMSVMKPASKSAKDKIRSKIGIGNDKMLVTMVAANKGNGSYHRKGLFENIAAFAQLNKEHPDTHLYMHTDPRPFLGGFDLEALLTTLGIDKGQVTFPDPDELMLGLPDKMLAEIYSASDILLAASYGEGFGVPVIEAQACGTPVITSNWTATKDLAGPTSYKVEGQLFWNGSQNAYFKVPSIGLIYESLKDYYNKWSGPSDDLESVEFVKQFEVETVWRDKWMPLLKTRFA